ncbi:TIGR04283 family arsenosugar biosynthesis glycosyltransferase [Planctomycetes bacterium K23_9]|uniref:Glucosyl-3-phosphoglycerate synthase n=1 Tax=Stieleria marina TaxID=1930275 RepID=A0A517NQU9_9BACT|nr:Glucosyl-3-phosphoglycerate synthase [Planctomycetes bacterium K23_9]
MNPSDISVVIPALNEQDSIGACIQSAFAAGATEVIVADGGSQDATATRATEAGATKVIRSLPGRGTQLNSGATFASKEYVLFLHADNRLSENCLQQICLCTDVVWGAFGQSIDSDRFVFRLLEKGNALRVKWRGLPFGDQAIFVRRSTYKQQGGFDEIPLMEDVQFSKLMRRIAKPTFLPGPITISARRWQKTGVVRQTLRNWKIQLAHRCGVSPQRLRKWYR